MNYYFLVLNNFFCQVKIIVSKSNEPFLKKYDNRKFKAFNGHFLSYFISIHFCSYQINKTRNNLNKTNNVLNLIFA